MRIAEWDLGSPLTYHPTLPRRFGCDVDPQDAKTPSIRQHKSQSQIARLVSTQLPSHQTPRRDPSRRRPYFGTVHLRGERRPITSCTCILACPSLHVHNGSMSVPMCCNHSHASYLAVASFQISSTSTRGSHCQYNTQGGYESAFAHFASRVRIIFS